MTVPMIGICALNYLLLLQLYYCFVLILWCSGNYYYFFLITARKYEEQNTASKTKLSSANSALHLCLQIEDLNYVHYANAGKVTSRQWKHFISLLSNSHIFLKNHRILNQFLNHVKIIPDDLSTCCINQSLPSGEVWLFSMAFGQGIICVAHFSNPYLNSNNTPKDLVS